MSDHFKSWVWVKACDAWSRASSFVGFEDRKIAYLQGFYAGYLKAIEESDTEMENLGGYTGSSFRALFKRWTNYAYLHSIHSKGELDDYEGYLDIFEEALKQKTATPKVDHYDDSYLIEMEEPLEHFLTFVEIFVNSAKENTEKSDKE